MSWMGLRLSGLSSVSINLKIHKTGGVVRTKVGRRPDEGSRKFLFVARCASSGRREGVVRTKETEFYFFSYRSVVRTTVVVRPDEVASSGRRDLSSGRRAYGRLKTYGKNVIFLR